MEDTTQLTDQNSSSLAFGRSSVYGLFSFLYRSEPDLDLVTRISRPEVFATLARAGMTLDRNEWLGVSPAQIVEDLAVDYTALFIAGVNCMPLNESVHSGEDGSYLGKSTITVGTFIESLGLNVDATWTGMNDHLSVEFEIMGLLAEREGVALEENDTDTALRCRELQSAFFSEHLYDWVPGLCAGVIDLAATSFYRELARVTESFLAREYLMIS